MLVKYVRDLFDEHKLVGCVVGTFADGEIKVGWSQCHPDDAFDKQRGQEIALGRALNGTKKRPCPYKTWQANGRISRVRLIDHEVKLMQDRAKRYFKTIPVFNPAAVDEIMTIGDPVNE